VRRLEISIPRFFDLIGNHALDLAGMVDADVAVEPLDRILPRIAAAVQVAPA
jgi:hypothetical protein